MLCLISSKLLAQVFTLLSVYHSYCSGKQVGVAGLFQVKGSSGESCDDTQTHVPSVMAAEAVKWTFRKLYENGDAPEIELIPYKTCGLSGRTTEAAIDILSNVAKDENIHLAGIIGPEFSQEAMILSDIITALPENQHLLQISYSATASILDDKTRFSNFFRVIPNDDKQVETMIELMNQMNWNRVAIVHDDDLYAAEIVKVLVSQARDRGICIPSTHELPSVGAESGQYRQILNDIIINRTPSIAGLVFVGRQQVGSRFVAFASVDDIQSIPAMILCESFQLERAALSDAKGQIYKAAKGSYFVTPEYGEVTEFVAYWKNLFMNQELLLSENTTNPWLLDIVEEKFDNCRPDGSSNCPQLTEAQIDEEFGEQPLYVRYAIMAAYAMAAAVRHIVKEKCPDYLSPCDQFYDTTNSKDVLDQMNGLDIHIGTDFNFTVGGLEDNRISFNPASRKENMYQVYNLQTPETDDFSFVVIGKYDGASLTLNTSDIRDYFETPDGFREHAWPDVRKAQCPKSYTCAECIPGNIDDDFVFVEGDFYIVALVPYRDSDSQFGCGGLAESNLNGFGNTVAILKAIHDFNARNAFNGRKVGVIIQDSCSNPTLADWRIKNILKSGLEQSDGSKVIIRDKILCVLASYFSSVSVAISQTLTSLRILHMAYGATSPTLSNRTNYPYFVRVATPDSKQAEATVNVLKRLGYTYIQLIYTLDAYGEGFRDSFLSLAKDEGICVVNTIGIDAESSAKINQVYQILRKKPYAKMVVVVMSTFVNELLQTVTASMDSGEFSFIGSESWGINLEPLSKQHSNKLLGSITINLEIPDGYDLENEMKAIDIDNEVRNPWKEGYLQSTMQCFYEKSFDKKFQELCDKSFSDFWETTDMKVTNWGPFSYLGAQSLLNVTTEFHTRKCGNEVSICGPYKDDLNEMIRNLKDTSTVFINGKTSKVFDGNGDGNTGYVIYNIHRKKSNPTQLEYVEIGRYSSDGSFDLNQVLKVNPTNEPFLSVCPNEKTCSECRPSFVGPEAESSTNVAEIAMGSVIGVLCLAIIILVVILILLCMKIQKMKQKGDGYLTPADVNIESSKNIYTEHFDRVQEAEDPL